VLELRWCRAADRSRGCYLVLLVLTNRKTCTNKLSWDVPAIIVSNRFQQHLKSVNCQWRIFNNYHSWKQKLVEVKSSTQSVTENMSRRWRESVGIDGGWWLRCQRREKWHNESPAKWQDAMTCICINSSSSSSSRHCSIHIITTSCYLQHDTNAVVTVIRTDIWWMFDVTFLHQAPRPCRKFKLHESKYMGTSPFSHLSHPMKD